MDGCNMKLSDINQKYVRDRMGTGKDMQDAHKEKSNMPMKQEMPHNMGIGMKKMGKVMHEYKKGTLHSGKSGKIVKSHKQAVAIGLSEARKRGAKIPIK